MKRAFILFLICILLLSCSPDNSSPPAITATPFRQPTSAPSPRSEDTFEVHVWLDNSAPPLGSRVIVWGSLIKSGVHLGGMNMVATWPDENQERGVPNCRVLVIYGSGVCVVETKGFTPDVYVPITVTFEYQGKTHSGQTGFTPH